MRRVSDGMRTTKSSSMLLPMNADVERIVRKKAESGLASTSCEDQPAQPAILDRVSVFTPTTSMDIFANRELTTSVTLGSLSPARCAGTKPHQSQMTTIVNSDSSQTFFPAIGDLEHDPKATHDTDSGDIFAVSEVAFGKPDDTEPRQVNELAKRTSSRMLADDVADLQVPEVESIDDDNEFAEFAEGVTEQDLLDLIEAEDFDFSSRMQPGHNEQQDLPDPESQDFDDGLTEGDFLDVLECGHGTTANSERQSKNVDDNPTMISSSDSHSGAGHQRQQQNLPSTPINSDFDGDYALEDNWQIFEDLEEDDQNEDTQIHPIVGSKKYELSSVTSPTSSHTPLPSSNGTSVKPIVRPPFPSLVKDRSPIVGLNSSTSLRICFRIGEALNAGSKAVREHKTVLIELYARVLSSYREPRPSTKQQFVLMDLFHDRPPYLNATYETWKGTNLYDQDGAVFLSAASKPRVCRCTGKLQRDNVTWRLEILNIWRASIEDAEYVAGIVQS